MAEKTCHKCGQVFELSDEFWHRNAARPDGFNDNCKNCVKVYYAERKRIHREGAGPGQDIDDELVHPPSARSLAFDASCLAERHRRLASNAYSIYRPI